MDIVDEEERISPERTGVRSRDGELVQIRA